VFEAIGGGFDRVLASVSYTMTVWQEIEILAAADAAGTEAINLTGNWWAQTIFGNAGNNVLDTGNGVADVLVGLGGDDIYFVHNASDWVAENAGQGFDRVLTSVSYRLAAGQSIEILAAANTGGIDPINLTGNELGQAIYGNAGANVLNTGGGASDTMFGFGGDDLYVIFNSGDLISETVGEGFDALSSAVSYRLAAFQSVEVMYTINETATTSINLTGNAFGQSIYGNAGANVLNGGGGDDLLIGGSGADSFVFDTALGAGNVDQILDYNVVDDTIRLDDGVFMGLAMGTLAASAFLANATGFAATASHRIIYETNTGGLYFDNDGVGGAERIQFATLTAGLALTNADFFVF